MAKSTSMFISLLLCHLVCADLGTTVVKGPTVISDIRASTVDATNARFLVNREDCLKILETRAPGLGLSLVSDVQGKYDTSKYSELLFTIGHVADTTLKTELDGAAAPPPVSTDGLIAIISLPVVSDGKHVLLQLDAYTAEEKPLMVPYYTNYRAMKKVESITLTTTPDGVSVITVQQGEDMIQLAIDITTGCQDDAVVGHDFDDTIGADIPFTNYPWKFDWGCDEYSFGFCDKINVESGEPTKAIIVGNVCTTMTSSNSRRCLSTAALNDITGGFLVAGFPVPVGTLPVLSIEAERISREHSTGIVFPCLRKPTYRQLTLDEMWDM